MSRRRRSGRAAGSRRAAALGEGAADVAMDSERSSDYVEQLAFKYMRKCKVESSTDSESDNNESFGTNVSIPTSHVDMKTMDFQKLQFLDPYDGDSEDTIQSSNSQCDEKCISDDPQDPCSLREESVDMDSGLSPISDPQGEVLNLLPYCNQLEKMTASWQYLDMSEKSNKTMASIPCSSDLSIDLSLVPDNPSVTTSRFFMIDLDSRIEMFKSPVFQSSLTSEENSDLSMFEASLIKRKGGIRTEGEKMRKKKMRVSEYMV